MYSSLHFNIDCEKFNQQKLLNIEAQLFKILDGSHMQIAFVAKNETDEDIEPFDVVLMLDYRIYDIRPKQFCFKEIGMSI